MSETTGRPDWLRIPYYDTVMEARDLAEREMIASGLAGQFGGPADA